MNRDPPGTRISINVRNAGGADDLRRPFAVAPVDKAVARSRQVLQRHVFCRGRRRYREPNDVRGRLWKKPSQRHTASLTLHPRQRARRTSLPHGNTVPRSPCRTPSGSGRRHRPISASCPTSLRRFRHCPAQA